MSPHDYMNQQPDFAQFFHQDEWVPLRYAVRDGTQFRHDVAYLSGYLHDAAIETSEIIVTQGGVARVPMERTTWETAERKHSTLGVAATFTIGQVARMRWKYCSAGGQLDTLPGPLPSVVTIRYIDTWMRLDLEDLFVPVVRLWTHEGPQLLLDLREPVKLEVIDDA